MISYQREILYDVIDEVGPLLELHYQELTLHKERIKLAPIWERYTALEKARMLMIFTVRDAEKLVGYAVFFVNHHIHYADCLVATNDVLFLHPDYRKGACGIKLLKFCERQLKDLSVDKLVFHVKFSNDFRPILHRLGYADEEVMVGKIL